MYILPAVQHLIVLSFLNALTGTEHLHYIPYYLLRFISLNTKWNLFCHVLNIMSCASMSACIQGSRIPPSSMSRACGSVLTDSSCCTSRTALLEAIT